MSNSPVVVRNPLGLPAGSVRAIIALAIAGTFIIHLLRGVPVPLCVFFLLALVPPFFTAHGTTIGQPGDKSPLYLPKGSIRLLITIACLAAIGYQLFITDFKLEILAPEAASLKDWPHYLLSLVGGLFCGMVLGKGPWRNWNAFQDLQAWISIVALFALLIEMVIEVINVKTPLLVDRQLWNTALIAVLSFYFASRS